MSSELQIARSIVVMTVGSCDVTNSVRTIRDEPVVGLALFGPIMGTVALFGDDAPEVQADTVLNSAGAAEIIGHLMERFEALGCGPALSAKVDQVRANIRAMERKGK